MRDLLEAVADGSLTPAEAEAALVGYVTDDAGRFDASRPARRGIPEAIYAPGKTPGEVTSLVVTALESTGSALVTRASDEQVEAVDRHLASRFPAVSIERRRGSLLARRAGRNADELDASVAIVTGGTADGPVADEAALVCEVCGVPVTRIDDVGVAALDRVLDQVDRIRETDVVIVAAGREGALPTVVAGLVAAPVIGVPVSSGYGHGGGGEAALAGLLQSCTVLSTVNVDAGFVAGAQATLIARAIDRARRGEIDDSSGSSS